MDAVRYVVKIRIRMRPMEGFAGYGGGFVVRDWEGVGFPDGVNDCHWHLHAHVLLVDDQI